MSPVPVKGEFNGIVSSLYGNKSLRGITDLPQDFFYYLENHADFRIDKYNKSEKNRSDEDSTYRPVYATRVEDVREEAFGRFLGQAIFNINNNNLGGVREHNIKYKTQAVFVDTEDGNDKVTMGDIAIQNEDISHLDIEKARERIPYLIKLLHESSKKEGIHLLSFLISYTKANQHNPTRKGVAKPQEILSGKVYAMDQFGNVGLRLISNNHKGERGQKWIRGMLPELKIELEHAMELMLLCEKIGYPLYNEDPTEYDEKYINELVVTHIENNRRYITRKIRSKPVNKEVLSSIKTINIKDFGVYSNEQPEQLNSQELALRTVYLYNTSKYIEENIIRIFDMSQVNHLFSLIVAQFPVYKFLTKDLKEMFKDGFMVTDASSYFIFDFTHLYQSNYSGACRCIISSDGYAVRITSGHMIEFVSIKELINYQIAYMQSVSTKQDPSQIYNRFGKWEYTVI